MVTKKKKSAPKRSVDTQKVSKTKIEETPKKTECPVKACSNPVFLVAALVCVLVLVAAIVLLSAPSEAVKKVTPVVNDSTQEPIVIPVKNETAEDDKVNIMVFSDFECGYSRRFADTMDELEKNYGDKISFEYINYPLSFHEKAQDAAEAGECAEDQGKFWELHDLMFDNQTSLSVEDIQKMAATIEGLNVDEFSTCLKSNSKEDEVQEDITLAAELGVSGTPAIFVGGKDGWFISGAQPYETFEDAIAKVLAGTMPPKQVEGIGSFKAFDYAVCVEGEKPVMRLYTTTWCPHCSWIKETFDEVMSEYVDAGKIVAHHWEVDTGDDSITEEVETEVPESELAVFKQFNDRGSIPTFVFGCKYYRVGSAYESKNDLAAEEADFRAVIEQLISDAATQ